MAEPDPNLATIHHLAPKQRNRLVELLAAHHVDVGSAAEALQALFHGIDGIASSAHASGTAPMEVVHEQMLCAGYDAAAIIEALGASGDDLEIHVVLRTTAERKREVTIHEAGHAVLATALGISVLFTSISLEDTTPANMEGVTQLGDPASFLLGYSHRPAEPLRSQLEPLARRVVAVQLAGGYAVADAIQNRFPSFGTDLAEARTVCRLYAPAGGEEKMWRESHDAAQGIVCVCRSAIRNVARDLELRRQLVGSEIADAVGHALPAHCAQVYPGLFNA